VWGWYCEIAAFRSGNGFGVNPISPGDIEGWIRLARLEPEWLEIRCLLDIEAAFMEERAKRDAGRAAARDRRLS
jgi:hypothetical protein